MGSSQCAITYITKPTVETIRAIMEAIPRTEGLSPIVKGDMIHNNNKNAITKCFTFMCFIFRL